MKKLQNIIFNESFIILFLLFVLSSVMFSRLGDATLSGDDCYYSELAKEMVVFNDYASPRFDGKVDFHTSKPPILFWMCAASGKMFGFTSWSMRLPIAITGFLGVVFLFLFVKRFWGIYQGFIASIVLTFTQQYMFHARSPVTDCPFAVFFAASLIFFWFGKQISQKYYYAMGIFLGLAIMTRQIPGFFICAVIIGYILLAHDNKPIKSIHFWLSLLVSSIIVAPWHILMYQYYGVGFIKQYFGVTLMSGFSGYSNSVNPSINPWYAYFQILANNYWPWLPFMIFGIYKYFKKVFDVGVEEKQKILFIFCWVFIPFVIFQIAKVKQHHYIMPLYFPFAIVVAGVFDEFRFNVKYRVTLSLIILTFFLSVAYIFSPMLPNTLDSRYYADTIKLIPSVVNITKDIKTLPNDQYHYGNCFKFYANKIVSAETENEIINSILTQKKQCYILKKGDFDNIKRRVNNKIKIIKETSESVLFE